jgi:hypothetical protein
MRMPEIIHVKIESEDLNNQIVKKNKEDLEKEQAAGRSWRVFIDSGMSLTDLHSHFRKLCEDEDP